jgi:hypothetical protein
MLTQLPMLYGQARESRHERPLLFILKEGNYTERNHLNSLGSFYFGVVHSRGTF